jgi:hypothetical protein
MNVAVNSNKREIQTGRATGAAAIALSVAVPANERRRVASVMVHLSAAPNVAGDLTVTLNANAGAVYDTRLLTQDMNGLTDLVWTPDGDIFLEAGDSVDVAFANAQTRTYGAQVVLEIV